MLKKLKRWRFFLYFVLLSFSIFITFLLFLGFQFFFRSQDGSQNLNNFYNLEIGVKNWLAESYKNDKEIDGKALQFLEELGTFSKSFDRYIVQQSLVYTGLIYWALEDYAAAGMIFETIFFRSKNSSVGLKAGLAAAAAYENTNSIKNAIRLYSKVAKQKKIEFFRWEAIFHLVRLAEKEDLEGTLRLYKKFSNELKGNNDYWKLLIENSTLSLELSQL